MRHATYCPVRRPAWNSRFNRISRFVTVGIAFAAMTTTAACSSDSDGPTAPGPVTGSFPMKTVKGFAVPHTFTDAAGSKLTLEGGSLTMNANGTYALHYKGKLNTLTFNLTDEGSVVVAGSSATFTPDDGDTPFTGTIQGKTIVVKFRIAGVHWDLGFTGN